LDSSTTPGQIVGRNVRAVRAEQLLSQRELAERSGVAKITIATMELGKSARPRRRTVEKLADALGVSAEDLIREDLTRPKAEAPPLQRTLFNGLTEERRIPVYISAASGAAGGATANLLTGLNEHFNAIVEQLLRSGLGENEVAEIVSEEVRRRVVEHAS
jgi:transcriptional regulator with XRE-family HTH domain